MTDTTNTDRAQIADFGNALASADVRPGELFFDDDGDVCVNQDGDNLVFCPAVDDDGRRVLHPEIIAEMVRLYNAARRASTPPPWGIDASNPSAVKLDDTRFRVQGRDRAKDGGRDE